MSIHSGTTRSHQTSGVLSAKFACTKSVPRGLDHPVQLPSSPLLVDDVMPDEEQEGGVTRGIRQRDPLGRPGHIRDGRMTSARASACAADSVCRLHARDRTPEGTGQRRGHAPNTRAQVEPGQWPRLSAGDGRTPPSRCAAQRATFVCRRRRRRAGARRSRPSPCALECKQPCEWEQHEHRPTWERLKSAGARGAHSDLPLVRRPSQPCK